MGVLTMGWVYAAHGGRTRLLVGNDSSSVDLDGRRSGPDDR